MMRAVEPPAITRRRRPFLAPIWLSALLALVIVGLAVAGWRSLTTTTIVLVRHAEKELGSIEDSPLSAAGEQRAERLAQMLGEIAGAGRLKAIYLSPSRRTQQTVAPLAARLQLAPIVLPAEGVNDTADRLLHEHRGGAVLMAGNAELISDLVRQLSGIEIASIPDNEFDDIYVVSVPTLGKATLLRLKY